MRFLARLLLMYVPALIIVFVLTTGVILNAMGMLDRKGMQEAWDFARDNSVADLVAVLKVELLGASDMETDPGYGRQSVAGRGHTPWVIRSNLDEQPRMLSFALQPGLWASYATETGTLYQVWQGELGLFGAAYNYRHGPQPESQGEWLIRNDQPTQWQLRIDGTAVDADYRYLGHGYFNGRKEAWLRYQLSVGENSVIITESPESKGQLYQRRFTLEPVDAEVGLQQGDDRVWITQANHLIEQPFAAGTILVNEEFKRVSDIADGVVGRGQAVIANSDCLSCHNEAYKVVGPSFARIAVRFRGMMQDDTIDSLATSIIQGGAGKWGEVPMTAHPALSMEDARAAATYILTLADLDTEPDRPSDPAGNDYAFTEEYSVGDRITALHPAFALENLLPEGFQPKVGGMAFLSNGSLVLSSWDRDGAVFLIDPNAPVEQRVTRIAEGLHEPLGVEVLNDRIFIMQKQELTELIDTNGDTIIDEYRNHSSAWQANTNFHSFGFGLVHKDNAFYALLSICVLPGGASCGDQLPSQGKLLRIDDSDGSVEFAASGFRTPNGIALGPNNDLFVNDNQGDWLPASKLMHVQAGKFYGSRAVPDPRVMSAEEAPPVVWLPQDEIGNSPTEPVLLTEGPYAGQMAHGDVYHGGIKRVHMEQVKGAWQGAVFRFSGGFQGGVNRFARGPDGALYVGEIGNPPNWGQVGKTWYGLERMTYTGDAVHEIIEVRAEPDGFTLVLGQPLAAHLTPTAADLSIEQWFYYPTEQYGGPKYDPQTLQANALELSADRRSLRARIDGLKAGYVVYLDLNDRLIAASGQSMWTHEAWYTLNAIPENSSTEPLPKPAQATAHAPNQLSPQEQAEGWELMFDGHSLEGWRNYGSHEPVEKWQASDGALEFVPGSGGMLGMIVSAIFGGGSGDLMYAVDRYENFELSLQWKISAGGNSGIFYFVADEEEKMPWATGLEMQVLDNDGHSDGRIITHRAGDLYDLVAADPETVLPPGEWNQVLIRVQDNRIEHWLNGVKVVSIERYSERWNTLVANSKYVDMPRFGTAASGYIVLQDHGDPVWYRNLKIRALN